MLVSHLYMVCKVGSSVKFSNKSAYNKRCLNIARVKIGCKVAFVFFLLFVMMYLQNREVFMDDKFFVIECPLCMELLEALDYSSTSGLGGEGKKALGSGGVTFCCFDSHLG